MKEFSNNEILVSYLLNEMPEGARDAFENRYFADDELFRKLSAAEAALINSYLRGDLPRAGRKKFRRQYMTSPHRVKKVEIAAQALGRGGLLSYLKRVLLPFGSGWQVAFASLSLLAVLTGLASWMLWDRRQMQRQLEQSRFPSHQQEPEGRARLSAQAEQTNAVLAAPEQLKGDPNNVRAASQQKEEEAARLLRERQAREGTPPRRQTASAIVAYTFPREFVRTLDVNGHSHEPLVLRRGVTRVRLRTYIEANSYDEYVVSLQRVGGSEIWKQVIPQARRRRTGEWMSFDIPAALFKGEHFILKVSGPTADGDSEVLAFHQLNVETPSSGVK